MLWRSAHHRSLQPLSNGVDGYLRGAAGVQGREELIDDGLHFRDGMLGLVKTLSKLGFPNFVGGAYAQPSLSSTAFASER